MSHRRMLGKGGGGAYQYIIDELSITLLDVLAFKKLTSSAGDYCVRIEISAIEYDIAWDSNNELSSDSVVYNTSGTPTGDTLGDLPYPQTPTRWYEQLSGGSRWVVMGSGCNLLDESGNDSYNDFSTISFEGNASGVYEMNTDSSVGTLPVSFMSYDKPNNSNINAYYLGNTGLNPTMYQRYTANLHRMRNGGSPFLAITSGVRDTWATELANFTASGLDSTYYLNNVLTTTGTVNNTTQFTRFKIGAAARFRYALSFDGIMSDADRTTLYNYMATFYP